MSIRLFLLTALLLLAFTQNVVAALATTVANTSLAHVLLAPNFNWMWIVARIQSALLIFAASVPASTTHALTALLTPLSSMLNVLTLSNAHKLNAVSVGAIRYLVAEGH